MLIDFFFKVRAAKVPATSREYLSLLEAMQARLVTSSIDDFYFLARLAMVKDEKYFDRYDRAFGEYFKGIDSLADGLFAEIPDEWLRKQAELFMSEEDRKLIESLGGWENVLKELRRRLEEQKERHEGGNKWIGTAGTSPFGNSGENPEGVSIGQRRRRRGRALKVWEQREYKNYDDSIQLGLRNVQVA